MMTLLDRRLDRLGLLLALLIGLGAGIGFAAFDVRPVDADMVWRIAGADHRYGLVWGLDKGSQYVYPPVLAQLVGLARPLGWSLFLVAWETLLFVAIWAATRMWAPLVFAAGLAGMLFLGIDSPPANPLRLALLGNVQSLMAAAIVIGMQRPAAWTVVLLTKIAPGIGLLWFAARAEWRSLGIAIGATVVVVLVSVALAPTDWADFIRFALANFGTPPPIPVMPVPLALRLPLVCLAVVWGARTNRPWVVPFAVGWASLALYSNGWVSIAIGALPLWWMGRAARTGGGYGDVEGATLRRPSQAISGSSANGRSGSE
jgi:hypothetical protein